MGKINNVREVTQYQRIMEQIKQGPRGKVIFSAKGVERKTYREPFTSENGSVVYPFEPARVADLLDERRVNEMMISDPRVPVFLENRPGKGKNYFILNILLKVILERGERMLILTPRRLLKTQTKIDLIAAQGIDLELYTDKRIETDHCFGSVDVYSYQEIQKLILLDGFQMCTAYSAVIFDEVQFFSQDSDFNCSTELIFEYLTSTFIKDNILRIYMTGTPDRIYDRIENTEKQYLEHSHRNNLYYYEMYHIPQPTRPTMFYYHFDSDYSYINPIFFKDDKKHSKLIDMITSSSEYKWLIFVESSAMGQNLIASLPKDKKAVFINADIIDSDINRETKEAIDKLVKNSEMPVEVLVITKCLDVGVNVKTKNVNIVCYLRDKIDFLQAIGRKRIDEDAKEPEVVNLYIPDRSKEDIEKWNALIEKTYNEYMEEIDLKPIGKPCNTASLEIPFYVKQGKLSYNNFTIGKLYYQVKDYENLLDEMISLEP